MFQVTFIDTPIHHFTPAERETITRCAHLAGHLISATIALPERLKVIVEASHQTLETGDNAYTESPHLIRWWVDPQRGVADVAQAHLAQALAHEAFHATRSQQLAQEASSRSLLDVTINEGLATAFARDAAGANESWATYDATVIQDWPPR